MTENRCRGEKKSFIIYLVNYSIRKSKTEPLNDAQNDKIDNVAGSVPLSLFMDGP
jgi:hypothetical protein